MRGRHRVCADRTESGGRGSRAVYRDSCARLAMWSSYHLTKQETSGASLGWSNSPSCKRARRKCLTSRATSEGEPFHCGVASLRKTASSSFLALPAGAATCMPTRGVRAPARPRQLGYQHTALTELCLHDCMCTQSCKSKYSAPRTPARALPLDRLRSRPLCAIASPSRSSAPR